ncbi:MAG: hypothetical protein FWC60_00955, partial [Firmicutes bacterium]|nr:hypothetical protein [Bacillota bacterium]
MKIVLIESIDSFREVPKARVFYAADFAAADFLQNAFYLPWPAHDTDADHVPPVSEPPYYYPTPPGDDITRHRNEA